MTRVQSITVEFFFFTFILHSKVGLKLFFMQFYWKKQSDFSRCYLMLTFDGSTTEPAIRSRDFGQQTLVLTAINWSQHWCPIWMYHQFSCSPKLARKYEIEHCSRSSKTINWSADSFQINQVTSMSWHMSLRYGHGILVSGYPVLIAVNWPYYECPL